LNFCSEIGLDFRGSDEDKAYELVGGCVCELLDLAACSVLKKSDLALSMILFTELDLAKSKLTG
jgi:hypothetical protein